MSLGRSSFRHFGEPCGRLPSVRYSLKLRIFDPGASITPVSATLPNSLNLSDLFTTDPKKGGRGYLRLVDGRFLSAGVAGQNRVGFHMPAFERDLAPVRRKPESQDPLRGEVRKLASGRAIERLLPQIIYAFLANHVHHGFGVWREGQR